MSYGDSVPVSITYGDYTFTIGDEPSSPDTGDLWYSSDSTDAWFREWDGVECDDKVTFYGLNAISVVSSLPSPQVDGVLYLVTE